MRSAILGLLAGILPASAVAAGDASFERFYLHVGPAGLMYAEGARMRAAGTPIPGADIRIPNSLTAAVEFGYFLTPNLAVGLAGGYPPRVKVEARGSITGLGTLGKVDGGPMALTAQYHVTGLDRFRPYIGAGPSLMVVFSNNDGAVTGLKTDHALGFAGQIGFNYMFDRSWGVFVDLKKVYLRAKTSGTLGGLPIRATAKLDPLVLHTGLTYTF